MPNSIRMKRTFLNVLLWLQFLLHFIMVLSLEPGFLDFDNLPETNFSCHGKVIGGYYADIETNCQMFHVCTKGQNGENMDIRFLCLNGTVFDQETRVCERIEEVDCSKSEQFFKLNLDLYQPSEEQSEIPLETAEPSSSTTTIKTTTSKFFTTSSSHQNSGYSSSSTPSSSSLLQPSRQILSHHFPLNSADLRFNPEEINISLNPDSLPPQIRRKNQQQHQHQNDQQSQFLIQTDSFRHSQSYPAHRTQSIPSPSNDDDDDDLRAFHRRYEKSSPRTVTVLSDFVNTEHSVPHHHHQRVQIPYSVLPTLPPLQFSSPAPFSPQDHHHHHHHHVDSKRYTKDNHHYSSSPRIIISASASVSDQSGHRLNYSLGTIDLDTPTGSYDEDVSLHEFYHDVPKIQRHKRSTLTQQLDAIKNEKEAMELLKLLFKWYENHKNVATTTAASSFPKQQISSTTETPSELNVTSPYMEIIRVTSPEFNIMTPHTFDTIKYSDDKDNNNNLITTTVSPLELFTTPAVTSDLIHTINAELAPTLLEENFDYSEEIVKNFENEKNLPSINSSIVNNTSKNSTLGLKKEISVIDPNDYVDDNYEPTIQKVSDASINDKRFINNEAVQQLYTYYSANDQLFADKIYNETSSTTSGPFLLKLLQQYASESEFLAADTTVTTPLANFEYPDIFATSSTETSKVQQVEADFTNFPIDENKTLIYEPTKINDLTTTNAPHLTTTPHYIRSRNRLYFSQKLDESYNKEETTTSFIEIEQSVTINPSSNQNARSSLEDETDNVEIEKSISLPIDLFGSNYDSTFLLPSTTEEITTVPTSSIKSNEEFTNLEDSTSTIPPYTTTKNNNSTNADFKTELETTSSFYESLIPTSSTITSLESNSVDSELSYLDYSSTIPTTTILDVTPDLTTSNDNGVSQDEYHENIFTTTTMNAVNLNTTTKIPPTTTRNSNKTLRRRRPHINSSSRLTSIGRHRFNTELNERSLTKKIPTNKLPMENRKSLSFNCFGKEINRFYVDPRDCRLFHYCTHGYTKNQLLDLKYVCDRQTYFDESKLTCTKNKPENCV